MFQQNRLNVSHNNNVSNHHISDLKSDIVRLVGSTTASSNGVAGGASNNNNNNERITSATKATSSTTTTTKLQRHSNNYLINTGNNNLTKQEEPKSHVKLRASNFHSLSQHSHQQKQVENNRNNHSSQDMQHSGNNQRNGQHQLANSATNPQIYSGPSLKVHVNQATTTSSRSSTTSQQNTPSKPSEFGHQVFNSSTPRQKQQQQQQQQQQPTVTNTTTSSSSSTSNFLGLTSQLRDDFRAARHSASVSDHQQERETNEVVTTMIKEELENDINSLKESELETLGSLERTLPIEVSFLLRQQAYCMAKMNYLDRQLRELKEAQHQGYTSPRATSSSTNINNNNFKPNNINLTATSAAAAIHSKNGNFIPSDDSGGEYSRATISDDDELSSLLDQIAKSVRPDQSRPPAVQLNQRQPSLTSRASMINHQQQQQHLQQMLSHQQRLNYNVISNPPPQQYTIINPNQLHHHQAVPVFVMSSPITVAHPSSISSNVLPGVHFQPEPRYNQYYEDFFVQNNNNSTPSTIHRHSNSNSNSNINSNGIRSHQFDSSMTAIEQLVSQKEKRQIKSQLKSADNWLKMHSSGLSTINGQNFSNTNFNNSNGPDGPGELEMSGNPSDRNIPTSTSTSAKGATTSAAAMATENSNSVIEETRNSR